jgi:hypothetical protein
MSLRFNILHDWSFCRPSATGRADSCSQADLEKGAPRTSLADGRLIGRSGSHAAEMERER